MLSNLQRLIVLSIRDRRRLFIRYNGQAHARVIEPHMLYRTPHGVLALVAYQVRGYHSSARRGTFWRPFQLDRIDSVTEIDEIFSARVRQGYETVAALTQGHTLVKLVVRPVAYGSDRRSASRGETVRIRLSDPAQTRYWFTDQGSLPTS